MLWFQNLQSTLSRKARLQKIGQAVLKSWKSHSSSNINMQTIADARSSLSSLSMLEKLLRDHMAYLDKSSTSTFWRVPTGQLYGSHWAHREFVNPREPGTADAHFECLWFLRNAAEVLKISGLGSFMSLAMGSLGITWDPLTPTQ